MAAAQEKSKQNRVQNRNDDRTKTPGPGRKKSEHGSGLNAPLRLSSIPALAAENPVDEFTGDSDYDEAKNPAKHVVLRSALDRLRDVSFFGSPQGDSSSSFPDASIRWQIRWRAESNRAHPATVFACRKSAPVPRSNRTTVLVTAEREFGDSFADSRPVTFKYYKLTRNQDASPGWPRVYFNFDKKAESQKTYCDVTDAFRAEADFILKQR